jgi:hypothetical protein
MTLKTTLLAGVAICGLMAAPALARGTAPSIHLAGHSALQTTAHVKTQHVNPQVTDLTETITFSGSASATAIHKVPITLLGETWYDSANCTQPTKQSWKNLPKKSTYGKVGHTTSTGTIGGCGSTIFTFQDILYTETAPPAKAKNHTDQVVGDLIAPNFNKYHLDLHAIVNLNLTK